MERALSKCDHEPVHLIPLIQGNGLLFTLDMGTTEQEQKRACPWALIVQASANTESYGLAPAAQLLRSNFFDLFTAKSAAELYAGLSKLNDKEYPRPSATMQVTDASKLPRAKDYEGEPELTAWWEGVLWQGRLCAVFARLELQGEQPGLYGESCGVGARIGF